MKTRQATGRLSLRRARQTVALTAARICRIRSGTGPRIRGFGNSCGAQLCNAHKSRDWGYASMIASTYNSEELINREYRYGFVTEIESDPVPRGVNQDLVRLISAKKKERKFIAAGA